MTKAAIIKKVEYWKTKLGLNNWQIDVQYCDPEYPHPNKRFVGIAKIHTQPTYKIATISIDPKKLGWIDSSVLLHELLHCHFAALVSYMRNNIDPKKHDKVEGWLEFFEEGAVSELERVLLRLHKKNGA